MMKVLVIDVGGSSVKLLASGHKTPRRFLSGPGLTPWQMVSRVKQLAADWKYDAVTIGYPGVVKEGRIAKEPQNLGAGWVGFDFKAAFGRPVQLINDAAMQALGSYKGGLLLFLGLGTGLGSALIANNVIIPMELAHLSHKGGTYENYMGLVGLKRVGVKKWREHIAEEARRLIAALNPDDVVFGGGTARQLGKLPRGCRVGDNAYAFLGGFRLWKNKGTKGR